MGLSLAKRSGGMRFEQAVPVPEWPQAGGTGTTVLILAPDVVFVRKGFGEMRFFLIHGASMGGEKA